jgi:dTDP-4-dehydrorhamnose reductase
MRVLITGAGGLVARHFAHRLACDHDVRALQRSELDVSDSIAVVKVVADFRPELLINGAVVQVDEAERDRPKAWAVNAQGPQNLAREAARIGAEMIHFGTQYVFAGEPVRRAPYTVEDEARPVNIYGQTKLAGEIAVRDACERSHIVRTAWIYGSGKNSFLCTVHDDLTSGRKVHAIDDIWSSTTYVEDLVDRCLEILNRRCYGTYHVVNDGACSYYDFALEAGKVVGLTPDQVDSLIEIVHERDMERAAARPRYTPLRCLLSERLGLTPMRHWKTALADYARRYS